jgi:hypothetical protein
VLFLMGTGETTFRSASQAMLPNYALSAVLLTLISRVFRGTPAASTQGTGAAGHARAGRLPG